MSAIELVYDYFEDHVRASLAVRERRPLALGVMGFLIGGASLFVAQALSHRLYVIPFSWAACALAALWKLGAGFLLAAVIHLMLEAVGVSGSAASLFILFGMADLSWAVAIPLILVARLLTSDSSWTATSIFFFIGLLSFSLKARSLQDNYQISLGKAWLALGLPYLAAIAAGVLVFSLAIMGAVMQLIKAFQ